MNYIYGRYASDYLMHHGILGQKWGVRRYQNKDGSLTNAGKRQRKKRYEDMTPQEKREYTRRKNARNDRIKTGLAIGATVAMMSAPFILSAIHNRSSGSQYNYGKESDYARRTRERYESWQRGKKASEEAYRRRAKYDYDYERRSREAYESWQRGKKAAEEARRRHANTAYKQAVKMTPAEAKERLRQVMKEAAAMEANGGMDINMKNRVMAARDAYKAAKAAAGQ